MGVLQEAAVRYRNSLIPPWQSSELIVNPTLITAFLKNIETLGFELSVELINTLRLSKNELIFKRWATDAISILKKVKGDNYVYNPMYPNFPEQVANASETELYLNAILHYFGDSIGVRILPKYDKEERFPLSEQTNLICLNLIGKDFNAVSLLKSLLSAKVSFSEEDIRIFTELACLIVPIGDTVGAIPDFIPDIIPNKENLAIAVNAVRGNNQLTIKLFNHTKTATDLLRIAAVYSGNHPSLTEKVRFGKFSRPERKMFLTRLNEFNNVTEDFKRNRELWKLFGEKLHPGELAAGTPVFEAFKKVRSKGNIVTWGTKVETAFVENNLTAAVSLLTERPGEFARRLNQLLDTATPEQANHIINEFASVATKISTPVLWQVVSFFRTLKTSPERKYSTLFLKGFSSKAFSLPRKPTNIAETVLDNIIETVLTTIAFIYSQRKSLGKVFVESDGYDPTVPFGLHNYSSAFKTVGRGTRTVFDTEKTLRLFVHWKDQQAPNDNYYNNRVDIDLSAVALDENFNYIDEIAYYNLQNFSGVHSGDITSAPEGASEFIDIPIKMFLKEVKARYVAMTVHSYTLQPFSTLNEVLGGFMVRESPDSGEIFDPKTVENVFKINSAAINSVPIVFDMVTGEAVWVDTPMAGNSFNNNVANTSNSLTTILQGIMVKQFIGVQEIVKLNIATHGVAVDSAEEADIVISFKKGETNIGFDQIISEWL